MPSHSLKISKSSKASLKLTAVAKEVRLKQVNRNGKVKKETCIASSLIGQQLRTETASPMETMEMGRFSRLRSTVSSLLQQHQVTSISDHVNQNRGQYYLHQVAAIPEPEFLRLYPLYGFSKSMSPLTLLSIAETMTEV